MRQIVHPVGWNECDDFNIDKQCTGYMCIRWIECTFNELDVMI